MQVTIPGHLFAALPFYDVTDTSVEYVTAMSKAKILPLLR